MEQNASLKPHAIGMLVVLTLEYLLGMAVNLFVQFPDDSTVGQLWQFAWKQGFLVAHMIIGTLLIIGASVMIVRAVRQKHRNWLIASITGALAILAAIISGGQFVSTQNDVYSYSMAASFIVAFIAYAGGLYVAK